MPYAIHTGSRLELRRPSQARPGGRHEFEWKTCFLIIFPVTMLLSIHENLAVLPSKSSLRQTNIFGRPGPQTSQDLGWCWWFYQGRLGLLRKGRLCETWFSINHDPKQEIWPRKNRLHKYYMPCDTAYRQLLWIQRKIKRTKKTKTEPEKKAKPNPNIIQEKAKTKQKKATPRKAAKKKKQKKKTKKNIPFSCKGSCVEI